ncbi:blue copper protein [Ziziphus jujuba]|uniref:Blue copper protein n=1 Tax=Ziziphus jujuba TaxID=326968 RepID=A0ABM4A0K7_ZIZJJ|nr:blue copper protein [Ziziphus jujuba]XP_060670267.1 blue copper protein [Ziziphus jujuba]XP_060670268.1 blue copper protein [Ziziphus jujuba]XP_060670269.1 blue copper protein [Ziziphus jujuba]XP_060670270.1 blue copper protein [Ziziphus jujuba]
MVGLRPVWAVKSIVVLIITSILFHCVSAMTDHVVGGVSGWDPNSNLQGWAADTTFQVGDRLVFRGKPGCYVSEVHCLDYGSCHAVHLIRTYNNVEVLITLTQPGSRCFIGSSPDHCKGCPKLLVQVQPLPQLSSDDDNGTTTTTATTTTTTISPSSSSYSSYCHPPPPTPPAAPALSNDKGGIEVPPVGSDNELQDKTNNPADATSASPPCSSGAGEAVINLLFWWVLVITTLVMLVSSG